MIFNYFEPMRITARGLLYFRPMRLMSERPRIYIG